ncbi:hypothetical protein DVDV_1838 [Desulfovibrio sp. DV]|nr:hypothetical protein DVDV_1838 [Desulfovibrio sp. DV]
MPAKWPLFGHFPNRPGLSDATGPAQPGHSPPSRPPGAAMPDHRLALFPAARCSRPGYR